MTVSLQYCVNTEEKHMPGSVLESGQGKVQGFREARKGRLYYWFLISLTKYVRPSTFVGKNILFHNFEGS